LHTPPERLVNDLRRRSYDLDAVLDRTLDLAPVHLAVRAPGLHPSGASIDEPAGIGLVRQQPADRDRVPAATIERGDAILIQFVADAVEAASLGVAGEDAANDLGLERLDLALPYGRGVHITVTATAKCLWDPPRPRPLQLAASRTLAHLLALDLTDKGARCQNEPADRCVLEALSHELQACAGLLDLVEHDADLVLVAGEPVDGVGDHDIGRASPQKLTYAFDAGPVEREAARSIAH